MLPVERNTSADSFLLVASIIGAILCVFISHEMLQIFVVVVVRVVRVVLVVRVVRVVRVLSVERNTGLVRSGPGPAGG